MSSIFEVPYVNSLEPMCWDNGSASQLRRPVRLNAKECENSGVKDTKQAY
jgi:hypothetical protein